MAMLHAVLAVMAVTSASAQPSENLVQLAEKLGLNELAKLLTQANLTDTLANKGPFTVFAPTDEAFKHLPPEVVRNLEQNKTHLTDLLLYHVANGKIMSSQIKNELLEPSLFGENKLRFNIYDGGKLVTVEGAPVAEVDKEASNGVIHTLHKVIFPVPRGSIVDLVSHEREVSTLLKAVEAANLTSALAGGPFTLFAPTNNAFAKISQEELNKLLANKTALTEVLTYHVVNSTQYAEGLTDGEKLPALNGHELYIRKEGAPRPGGPHRVEVDNARVERADISCTNGVIHFIDAVLIPRRPPPPQ